MLISTHERMLRKDCAITQSFRNVLHNHVRNKLHHQLALVKVSSIPIYPQSTATFRPIALSMWKPVLWILFIVVVASVQAEPQLLDTQPGEVDKVLEKPIKTRMLRRQVASGFTNFSKDKFRNSEKGPSAFVFEPRDHPVPRSPREGRYGVTPNHFFDSPATEESMVEANHRMRPSSNLKVAGLSHPDTIKKVKVPELDRLREKRGIGKSNTDDEERSNEEMDYRRERTSSKIKVAGLTHPHTMKRIRVPEVENKVVCNHCKHLREILKYHEKPTHII